MIDRASLLAEVAVALGNRPVRWTDEAVSRGDFDGREWAIDVFDIPAAERRASLEALRPLETRLRREHSLHLTFIFHTPEATTASYAWVRLGRPIAVPILSQVVRPTFVPVGVTP